MASRSSPSTHSQHTTTHKPSERSRAELPTKRGDPTPGTPRIHRDPADKKHQNIDEVQQGGRQSDQGNRPGGGKR